MAEDGSLYSRYRVVARQRRDGFHASHRPWLLSIPIASLPLLATLIVMGSSRAEPLWATESARSIALGSSSVSSP